MSALRFDEVAEETVRVRLECCGDRRGACLHRSTAFVRVVRHRQGAFALNAPNQSVGSADRKDGALCSTWDAFPEPEGRARQSPARRLCIAKLRRARSDAPYRFKVPMHARKRMRRWELAKPLGSPPWRGWGWVRGPNACEKSRMRAFHELARPSNCSRLGKAVLKRTHSKRWRVVR